MSADEWAQGEIIRTLQTLAKSVKSLDEKMDSLGTTFVTKEMFDLRIEHEMIRLSGQMVSKRAVAALVIGACSIATAASATLALVLH